MLTKINLWMTQNNKNFNHIKCILWHFFLGYFTEKLILKTIMAALLAIKNLIAKCILKLCYYVLWRKKNFFMVDAFKSRGQCFSILCPLTAENMRECVHSLTLALLGEFQREMRCQWDVICFGFWQPNKW